MRVPAVTVPVSPIATFTVLLAQGFSIDILTLLALVPAIGLVVDDAIVVLENAHRRMEQYWESRLAAAFRGTGQVGFAVVGTLAGAIWLFQRIPQQYAPKEDRGSFSVLVNGPKRASYARLKGYTEEIERRLLPYSLSSDQGRGEAIRVLVRAPRSFGGAQMFSSGIVIMVLNDFALRRGGWAIMDEIRAKLSDLPGVKAFPVMRQGFGARIQKPVQFVIGGGTYQDLAEWRDILLTQIEKRNPGLTGIESDYKETKPQLRVAIDYDRAADLGAAGSIPPLLSSGASTETRIVIATVILSGVLAATAFTLLAVPVAYDLLAPTHGLPGGCKAQTGCQGGAGGIERRGTSRRRTVRRQSAAQPAFLVLPAMLEIPYIITASLHKPGSGQGRPGAGMHAPHLAPAPSRRHTALPCGATPSRDLPRPLSPRSGG